MGLVVAEDSRVLMKHVDRKQPGRFSGIGWNFMFRKNLMKFPKTDYQRQKMIFVMSLLILYLLFPLIFNIGFFMLGDANHAVSEWICYGFIHLAYICMLLPRFYSVKYRGTVIASEPLYLYGVIYFIIQLLVGLVFLFIEIENYKWLLYAFFVLFFIYLVFFISTVIVNKRIR